MRVSTGHLFDSGTLGITRNQFDLFKLQNQLSTGRRVLSPADDPVAAAQALVTTQSKSVNAQYMENQGNAEGQLRLLEGNLSGLTDLLQDIRERSVQLGNATLTDKERSFISSELQSRFEQLLGLANEQNGAGEYLYSGFQGATKPFAVNPASSAPFMAGSPSVDYFGDEGERLLQVAASRQLGITASGVDVFTRIRNGNGVFSVSTLGNAITAQANSGTGLADAGSVLDISKLDASPVQPQDFRIQFRVDNAVLPPVTYYALTDATGANSLTDNLPLDPAPAPATPLPSPPGPQWQRFTPGQAIAFNTPALGDIGIQVTVSGDPADGDQFAVRSSDNQSLFDTVKNLVDLAGRPVPVSSAGNTQLMNDLTAQISALDRGLDNVLRVRATVGSRLSEIEALKSIGGDLDLQYSEHISNLQDLDYAKAISDLTRRQMQLEAAQQTFSRVTGLTLFDVLR